MEAITIDAIGSRNEEGCYRFDVLQNKANPNKFTFYEVYKSAEARAEHRKQDHFETFFKFAQSGLI